jgi:hypothetical protein
MSIALLNERLALDNKTTERPVDQTSYAELDELAIPEFSRLYVLTSMCGSYASEGSTVIAKGAD